MGEFWTNFWANALATLGLALAGWVLAKLYARWEFKQRPHRIAMAFDSESAQFKRYETIEKYQLTRVFFVVGVVNNTGYDLREVQAFVLGVQEYRGTRERHPLQPVGAPKGSDRINVPPSTNNRPSAYFEIAEMYLKEGEPEHVSDMAWLSVTYGESALAFSSHVQISIEGEGFAIEGEFHVYTRTNGYTDDNGKWHEPGKVGLHVRRLR